jgi:MFS family permease
VSSGDAGLRALLGVPAFLRYQAIRLGSVVATQMMSVAVGWEVWARTHDPLSLGVVGGVQFLPVAALVLSTGDVADRFDRRKVLLACHALITLVGLALAALSLGDAPIALVYVPLFLFGIARAYAGPAGQALAPSLVPPELFARAVALQGTTFQLAIVIGPALGGLLYAALGAHGVYLTCVVLEVAVVLLLAGLDVPAERTRPRATGVARERLLGGIRYIRSRPVILGAISLDLFAVLFGGAVALMPIFADEILHVGETGLGLLRSAPAVGALVVALFLGARPLDRSAGKILFASVAIYGLATIGFGLSTDFFLSLVLLAIAGGADMVSVVVRHVVVQAQTPPEMRGRVSAVNMVFIGASNELGEMESGLAAAWLGTVPAVVVGGLASIAVTAVIAALFPTLRRTDRLEAPRT